MSEKCRSAQGAYAEAVSCHPRTVGGFPRLTRPAHIVKGLRENKPCEAIFFGYLSCFLNKLKVILVNLPAHG